MPKQKVYFRTDANPQIGMGHLVRCSALAAMIDKEFEISFVTKDTPKQMLQKFLPSSYETILLDECADEFKCLEEKGITNVGNIIVLDNYSFDEAYQKAIKKNGARAVYIDDLIAFNYNVDVLINQAENVKESDYKSSGSVKFCLGTKFILLREPFLKAANSERQLKKIESVFVSFGGADMDNVSRKVVNVLLKFPQLKHIHVLSSSVNENIDKWKDEFNTNPVVKFHNDLNAEEVCSLMQSCELALGPCSNLSLELCSIGIIFIAGTTASNQDNYYKALSANSCILGIGKWQEVSEQDLHDKLASVMIYDEKDLSWFVKNQRQFIDGKSGERLRDVFLKLAQNN
jgi:UDP-2,4-diacetamido-2,4,6-trideoxy-beta-L-altropyranose hydrolase